MPDENRYEILQEVGRGAMGVVYKALDRETSECVALKVLKTQDLDDKLMMHRFKNEMRIARKITHKNVCRIYEFTRIPNGPCISMEYVDGETIRSFMNRIGVFGVRSALDIIRQICSGLHEAHTQDVVHRDLKPENLMIDRNGVVKIMDFGVARMLATAGSTLSGAIVGTPAYMAPEQVEGLEVDQRADIYSLGLVLYEMVTGSIVFRADTPMAVAYKQVHEAPPPPRTIDPNIPESVEALILRCIEKEPERRFQTIAALEAALSQSGYRPFTADTPNPDIRTTTRNSTFIMARQRARMLMMLVQVLYFSIYGGVLYYVDTAARIVETAFGISGSIALSVIVILAMCGIATRVYLSSALTFDHPDLQKKFRRLFPTLWVFDSIWAASPLLLMNQMRLGLVLGSIALLAYVPFAQKTLMENLSGENRGSL